MEKSDALLPSMSSEEFFLKLNTQIAASVRSEMTAFVGSLEQNQKEMRAVIDATRVQVSSINEVASKTAARLDALEKEFHASKTSSNVQAPAGNALTLESPNVNEQGPPHKIH